MTTAGDDRIASTTDGLTSCPNASHPSAELHPNYGYVLQKCVELCPMGRILDFGCGKGQTVEEGRRRNLDIYGVEVFGDGSGTNIRDYLNENGMLGTTVREIVHGRIPFPDNHFDVVLANQVFEHVVDLGEVVDEITRVLKPGGYLLALFPTLDTVREAHCRIIIPHWLPKSSIRFLWLLFWRSLGFGRLKRRRSRVQWARFFNEWLETSVHYRSEKSITDEFGRQFDSVTHLEEDYVVARISSKVDRLGQWLQRFPLNRVVAWSYRRWCGVVILAQRRLDAGDDVPRP